MTAQFSLFHRSIEERWMAFDRKHPEVYEALVRATAEASRLRGRKRLGVRAIWERMRWELFVEHEPGDFKLNDHYTSRYVRKLVREYPEFAALFELRELRAV